jgi:hypothetical protein
MVRGTVSRGHQDLRVLDAVKWIFLAMGLVAAGLFALAPDPRAHPQLLLLGGTGLLGALMLHGLGRVLGSGPR